MSHKITLIGVKNNIAYVNIKFEGYDEFNIEISEDNREQYMLNINKENNKIPKLITNALFEKLYVDTIDLINDKKRCLCGYIAKKIFPCCFCGTKVCDKCYVIHDTTFELYCDECTSVCEKCGKVVFYSEDVMCSNCSG